jgi:hypothetical protein
MIPNLHVTSRLATGRKAVLTAAFFLAGIAVASAQFLLSFNVTQPLCFGQLNGSVTVTAIGGVGPYTYLWSTGATTQTISNIGVGTYSVTVTASNNAVVSQSVTVTQPTAVTAVILGDTCQLPSIFTAIGSGGTAPYTYAWDTGDLGQSITISSPGIYCVTVVDVTLCGVVECIKIEYPPVNVSVQATNLICPGVNTGQVQATASSGLPPYTFSWSNGGAGPVQSNLPAGTYTVTVTDARGCTASASATVISPPSLLVGINGTGPTCQGFTNGSAMAQAVGGTPPYTFTWSTGATGPVIANLAAGTYSVTVSDFRGCTAQATVVITPQSTLVAIAGGTAPNCPGFNTGSATVSPSGGTGTYSYIWSTGGTTQTITGLAPGTYSVTVSDGLGCTATASAVVPAAQPFTISMSSTNSTSCGANNGTASVLVTQGIPPFTYAWSNGVVGNSTINNLAPGTYTVTVTSGNNCQAFGSVVITQPPLVFVSIAASPLVCVGSTNGTATANVTGGTAPFNYVWNTGSVNSTLINLPSGNYSVTVTDINGCQANASVTILPAPLPLVTVTAPPVVCGAGSTATAIASATNGTPPYTFVWSNGTLGPVASGLTTGVYIVTATDQNQCAGAASVNIVIIDNLAVSINRQNVLCFGGNTGSATASGSGGTAPYTYAWSNGVQGPVNPNLSAGPYTVTVTDLNGCTAVQTTLVSQPPLLTVSILSNSLQVCPGESTATLTAQPAGGTPPYTYLWSTGDTTPTISNQPAGTYSVTVTDANGCTASASVMVTSFDPFQVNITGAEIVCGDANSGEAGVIVFGGTGPFTYLWSTGANSESVGGLGTGVYAVTVTDVNGCSVSAEISILVVSDFEATVTPRDVLCFGENNGSALAIATGGTPPYSYVWSTGAVGPEALNLSAGAYFVTITEANDCVIIAPVTISQPAQLVLTTTKTDVLCFGNADGLALASVSGGVPPYQINWSNGQTGPQATGLAAGVYSVTVEDVNGCTASASVTINQPVVLSVSISSVNPLCAGLITGSATATAVGGTAPYTFAWSNNTTGPALNNLAPGSYTVTVTDLNGCTATASVAITAPAAIVITLSQTNIICSNNNIGAINANVTGGTGAYTYLWSNGQTGASINNLAPGTYSLIVTDANGCQASASATITQSMQLAITPAVTQIPCFGLNNGGVNLSVSGGTPPYTYIWSNGATTSSLSGLSPGTYSVTVTAQDGCDGSTSVVISQPTLLTASATPVAVTCNGLANGSISTNVNGGTPPYSYLWNTGAQTPSITGLIAGSYSVTVTDLNGCTANASATVTQPTAVTVSISSTQIPCAGSATGALSASAAGGTGPYTYQWSNGASGAAIQNLLAGSYTVTATDAQGCTATASFTLTAFSTPSCSINIVSYVVNGNDGALGVTVTGGTSPYTYVWSNGSNASSLGGLAPGTYSVTVTDANGCTTTCTRVLPIPAGVGDFVWLDINFNGIQDPGEPGIPGVTVIISGLAENTPYADTTVTNATGFYFFPVPPGEYKVTFLLPPGSDLIPTITNAGNNDAKDSDMDPISFMTVVFVVPPGTVDLTWDAGFTPPCINIDNPGTIGPVYQFLCGPGNIPATLTSITLPSGGTTSAPIEYVWMRSVVNGPFDSGHWEMIPNSYTPDFNPGPVYQTTYFARCARRVECGPLIESNVVIVEVGNISVANISGPSIVCVGESATFFATGTAPGAVINWTFGPGVVPQSATGSPVTVTFTSFGTFQITLTVTQNGCTATGFKQITVTNSPIYCGTGLVIHTDVTPAREVMVEWELPEQEPNHLYVVERSADGIDFSLLAEVTQAYRIEGGFKQYRFMDQNPKLGRNYYRVKYVPAFGASGYSNMEEVLLFGDSRLVHLYPNPVSGTATLEIFETFNGDVGLEIISADGKRLNRMVIPRDATRYSLDFSAYPAGVYFLRLRYGDVELKRLKVVKQ